MNKNHLNTYINAFFDSLELYDDLVRGHSYKTYIHQAIMKFLEFESKNTAMDVYIAFFDAYRITLGDDQNAFVDLLDMMRNYEEKAAMLTEKQRDHYVHSVNVFLLGLGIFSQNTAYRKTFKHAVLNKKTYPFSYDTKNEEFFYRWGIASLFHDAGYPIEIIHKQADQYLNFIVETVGKKEEKVQTFLEFTDFSKFNILPRIEGFTEFIQSYLSENPGHNKNNAARPLDLLANEIATSFGLSFSAVKQKLDSFLGDMQRFNFVDHGFYSAVIVLQWYAYLMQLCKWKSDYFFTPIADCATAILLHNYYGNVLQKKPFLLPPMDAEKHPIGWLLILCDELQEWNRKAYGWIDKKNAVADRSDVMATNDYLKVFYVSEKLVLGDSFERQKEDLICCRLNILSIFPDGLEVDSMGAGSVAWNMHRTCQQSSVIPRPLLPQIEAIAKIIHSDYVAGQVKEHKSVPPELQKWDTLPEDIKYSNISQARHISEKLYLIGCGIAASDTGRTPLEKFKTQEVEQLSILEHNRWMAERQASGWRHGAQKDIQKKQSPHLVPWENLTEQARKLDRNAVLNIIQLLRRTGLIVYRK